MKLVFAPDSFKGSLSAVSICDQLEHAARRHFPDAQLISVPVADGGEGTLDALLRAAGGQLHRATVTGPIGESIAARYAILKNGVGVVEMAEASGLPLVPASARDPLLTTSHGTGELIARLLSAGVTRILIGIGGSATNDGGMGILIALGARFLNEAGNELPGQGASLEQVARIELDRLHPALKEAQLTVLSDVTNPLLGENGATYIYGPQKGADSARLAQLESGMAHYAAQFASMGYQIASFPGAGAAGGVGAALKGVLGAKLERGIDAVLDAVGFDELISGADLIVTGEGRIDRQSMAFYKVPAGVATRAKKQGIPTIALVGGIGEGAEAFHALGGSAILPIVDGPMTLEQAMEQAPRLMESAADRLFRLINTLRP